MKITLAELTDLIYQALARYGYNAAETKAITEVLLYAQMRGNNQGIVKLIGAGIPNGAGGEIEVVKDSKAVALLDAHQNHAMIAINKASEMAVQKAKLCGIAAVGVQGINTSSGAIGFYARKIAEAGLVGLVFTASPETVAAEGSYEPIFGTNPLAIGIPDNGKALVLDMATAAMAYFGVIEANIAGTQLPEGIAYNKAGNVTSSPAEVLDGGALRTFDQGYKGSHLSMMIQILAGPLVGAAFMGEGDGTNNWGGHLVIALDPEFLGGTEALKHSVDTMVNKVKATKKLPGTREILVPSERGDRRAADVMQSGVIDIEDNLLSALRKVAEQSHE